jgi:hypothetical protein
VNDFNSSPHSTQYSGNLLPLNNSSLAPILLLSSFQIIEIFTHCAYLACCTLVATMLLIRFTLIAAVLETGTSALAHSVTFAVPTPTLAPRDTATATTTAIEFMTTEYITIAGETNDHFTRAPETIIIAVPTCIQTITPDKNGFVPPGTCNALYDYYPNFTAAVVFAALFGMSAIAHISQATYFKTVCSMIT